MGDLLFIIFIIWVLVYIFTSESDKMTPDEKSEFKSEMKTKPMIFVVAGLGVMGTLLMLIGSVISRPFISLIGTWFITGYLVGQGIFMWEKNRGLSVIVGMAAIGLTLFGSGVYFFGW
ncbi:hypothetical protein M3689_02620 [Alkalihalophilus marmarensis]|jgi:hypothetical protein|uniref:Uncharacterized protein n=1 Tax=Alkalihalophilus marmarensis DSM 21297 TaxID=1188261 RepID=U6SSW2_9BACI|nr:hypothetical protein [Alkalihalophilus marmarensis]ERN54432.1 hypothetical protein A33I_08405 [Alkalihalophilus marmarensis DSM 21297]MCM3488197.1 hypothetical protein [Alkalihalophilus marmarensis]